MKTYRYQDQAEKLANMRSTQGNESMNNLITTKAPKRLHYSGSDSLDFRVASAVLQKNEGHTYVVDVSTNI